MMAYTYGYDLHRILSYSSSNHLNNVQTSYNINPSTIDFLAVDKLPIRMA